MRLGRGATGDPLERGHAGGPDRRPTGRMPGRPGSSTGRGRPQRGRHHGPGGARRRGAHRLGQRRGYRHDRGTGLDPPSSTRASCASRASGRACSSRPSKSKRWSPPPGSRAAGCGGSVPGPTARRDDRRAASTPGRSTKSSPPTRRSISRKSTSPSWSPGDDDGIAGVLTGKLDAKLKGTHGRSTC